ADNYMAVFAKGYASAVKNQPDGGTAESPVEVNFKLEKGHFAAGVVVTAKGAPIEGLDAQMGYTGQSDENNLLRNSRQGRRQAHTDADGKFRFEDLSNRAVTVNLTGKGWTSLSNKALALDQETRIVMKEGGVIKGRVVEGDSQTPVKLFTVKARGARSWDESSRMGILFNSPDGAFTLYELEQDEDYSLRVSAQGFVSALQEELKAGPESDVKPVVFKLSRGQETKGVVLDGANQQPLAGATVLLYSATTEGGGFGRRSGSMVQFDNSPEEGVIRVLTGADGAFSFREGETLGYLAVKAPDFSPLVISANERDQYGGPRSLRIVMKRGGAVRGTVTLNGNPLPEANIYAYRTDSRNEINISSSSGEPQNNQVMTDASGAYRISGLAAGSYQLSVNGSSGKSSFSKSEKFDLTDGEEKLLDIAIGGGSGVLYGRVLKGTAPVPQANISVDPKRNEGGITRQSSTDGKGEYRIEGLEDGAYNANVNFSSGEDSSNLSEDVSVSGETQKDFTLPEKRKVTFKIVFDGVTDPTKAPTINNANLNIKDSFDSSDSSKKLDSYGYCHNPQDNLFTFRGRFKGAYRLNVQGQTGDNQQFNYQRPEALALDNLDADQDLGESHLSFLTGSTLKGMVMDLTGKAIKDAGVTLTPETHMGGDSFSSNNSSTNEEGRYQIFGLRDGAYTARIYSYRSRSTAMQMSETVEIKGATEHDFILLQSFKVTAKLTAPKDPNFRLSDLQNASLARQGVRDDPGKDPLQITPYGNGEISKGQIVFTGRFMGDYALSVNVKNKNIRIPGTFKLDNMDHDQDLGEIPLPTMGTILLRISIPDASIKRPNYCQLMLLPAQPQPDGSGPVNQSQSSYSVDLSKAEQEIGPVPEGSYRAALTMDTWKGDPMVVPVTITAGERPIVAFSLKPWIVLSGSVAMPDGFPKDAMPSVIALSGPGGTRTVTPQKGKGPDTEARLLGKDWAWTIFFMFQNLQEGTWRLTVEAEGCLPFSRDCEVKLGEGMRNQVRVVLKSR
ncbi:MAG: carboxypeptidase-like regulatory domain-containing protein, partial [Candidatus Sumerlaeota bacterium]|nr:carboxypeptidase-like regulatory domain-containing protein [Candidatus Sumerlaeota bacterium]